MWGCTTIISQGGERRKKISTTISDFKKNGPIDKLIKRIRAAKQTKQTLTF